MLVYAKYRGGAFSGKPHTEKRPLKTIFVLCLLIIYHQIGFNLRSKNGNHELFSRMSYVKKSPRNRVKGLSHLILAFFSTSEIMT